MPVIYSNNASRKTYDNLKNMDKFIKKAFETTIDNIKLQQEFAPR